MVRLRADLSGSKNICHDNVMETEQDCAPGSCFYNMTADFGGASFCVGADDLTSSVDSAHVCGPVEPVGYDCGNLIQEGWRICDPSCSNIVSVAVAVIGLLRRADLSSIGTMPRWQD